jgi:hypothetical protein
MLPILKASFFSLIIGLDSIPSEYFLLMDNGQGNNNTGGNSNSGGSNQGGPPGKRPMIESSADEPSRRSKRVKHNSRIEELPVNYIRK